MNSSNFDSELIEIWVKCRCLCRLTRWDLIATNVPFNRDSSYSDFLSDFSLTQMGEKEQSGPDGVKYFRLSEIEEQNTFKCTWIIINNKVYDVTKFLEEVRSTFSVSVQHEEVNHSRNQTTGWSDLTHTEYVFKMMLLAAKVSPAKCIIFWLKSGGKLLRLISVRGHTAGENTDTNTQ